MTFEVTASHSGWHTLSNQEGPGGPCGDTGLNEQKGAEGAVRCQKHSRVEPWQRPVDPAPQAWAILETESHTVAHRPQGNTRKASQGALRAPGPHHLLPAPRACTQERIQFSSPCRFLGGPGMFSRTSWASWDLFRTTPFSFTAVCILLTLDWFLQRGDGHSASQPVTLGTRLGQSPNRPYFTLVRKGRVEMNRFKWIHSPESSTGGDSTGEPCWESGDRGGCTEQPERFGFQTLWPENH